MKTKPSHTPTPDEIAQACLAIQSKWTENERYKRAAWAYVPAAVRVVEVGEVGEVGVVN